MSGAHARQYFVSTGAPAYSFSYKNGSDAGDKITKALPHVTTLMNVFKKDAAETTLQKIRAAKKLGIAY